MKALTIHRSYFEVFRGHEGADSGGARAVIRERDILGPVDRAGTSGAAPHRRGRRSGADARAQDACDHPLAGVGSDRTLQRLVLQIADDAEAT